MSTKDGITSKIGMPSILFYIFLTLKLTNHISWSWWWVTSPLWIGFSVAFIVALIIALWRGK